VVEDTKNPNKPIVGDVSLHGYFRGGYGLSSDKGRMTCFQAPGAMSKYRLGNECDQYGEFHFSVPVYVAKDGMVATAHIMPALWLPTTTLGHPGANGITPGTGETWSGAGFNFPFMFLEFEHVPGLSEGKPWIGQRYYKREDFHSTDFFYWNPSGLGAGIEDIQLGSELKLSYAAFAMDAPNAASVANPSWPGMPPSKAMGFRNDIQLRGIRLYPSGELQLGLNIIANWSNHDADNSTTPATAAPESHPGWSATIQHVQTLASLNGANKLAFQYGQGGGVDFGKSQSLNLDSNSTRIRIVDVLTIDPTDWFGVQAGLVFQHDKGPADTGADWISVGARGSFAFSDHVKLLVDIGHDSVMPKEIDGVAGSGDTRSLTKVTIAPALSGGRGVMTRPELRAFVTIANWNDAARVAGVDSRGIYTNTDKKMGATFGFHSEVWW
jgi:maltoporin